MFENFQEPLFLYFFLTFVSLNATSRNTKIPFLDFGKTLVCFGKQQNFVLVHWSLENPSLLVITNT